MITNPILALILSITSFSVQIFIISLLRFYMKKANRFETVYLNSRALLWEYVAIEEIENAGNNGLKLLELDAARKHLMEFYTLHNEQYDQYFLRKNE